MPTALTVAVLVALVVAIVGWFRPVRAKAPNAPTYSAQQITDAKTNVCAQYQKVHDTIKASAGLDMGTRPNSSASLCTNWSLSASGWKRSSSERTGHAASNTERAGNDYLETRRSFPELTVEYINSTPDSEMEQPTVHAADEATLTVERLCK
ncbi:hypothetical protein [Mycobacterium sp. pR1184]|uniref:hypothetical protein n=1 Tax=Mycobacterium sp. pR1184 TaxID=3238981 RepID=UPI00351B3C72